MQANVAVHDHDHHHDSAGIKLFGFWIYLMSDCVLFATLFATYAVLESGSIAGPTGKDIFELPFVFVETMLLLFSALPPAVLNFLVAERFNQEPQRVASIVLIANFASILVIPTVLWAIL